MRGILRAATAVGVLLSSAAFGLHAQARVVIGLGGGLALPIPKSKFNSVEAPGQLSAKSLGFGGLLYLSVVPKPNSMVDIRFDVDYDNVHYTATPARTGPPKMSIRNVNLDAVFHLGDKGSARPYLMVGPSFVSWDYRTGSTAAGAVKGGFGFNGGLGVGFGSGKYFTFFGETRYIWTSKRAVATGGTQTGTGFLQITLGVRIKPMEKTQM